MLQFDEQIGTQWSMHIAINMQWSYRLADIDIGCIVDPVSSQCMTSSFDGTFGMTQSSIEKKSYYLS